MLTTLSIAYYASKPLVSRDNEWPVTIGTLFLSSLLPNAVAGELRNLPPQTKEFGQCYLRDISYVNLK